MPWEMFRVARCSAGAEGFENEKVTNKPQRCVQSAVVRRANDGGAVGVVGAVRPGGGGGDVKVGGWA